ncbi:hypothetical protein K1T71_010557 [Dendrolimus kikuchii]|uniref:Uncharacterized protein n=1 Tax=Dendrolimus kikuchii TaxID=765133 RepID=A0ACC1CP93_9NEOP|nr:hypothetical protein K1T71_010557 [Dendrolimus kikuchii]
MGWSAVTCLLILLATATHCSKLVADNTILDDIETTSDSSTLAIINTTPNNNSVDDTNAVSTSTFGLISSSDLPTTTYQAAETTNSIFTFTDTTTSSSEDSETGITVSISNATDEAGTPALSVEEIEGTDEENVVQTTHGKVKGFQWTESPGLMAYIDIPYGAFEGYFKPPVPPKSWSHVHHETEHTKRCPQIVDNNYVGDLDCLTLSVFAPDDAVNASVLFHIHESHFASGSGDPAKYGPEYLVTRGIILVIPNYRLGPLGFLCLRNETAPGNAGLKDLTLALEWTRENIHSFGGNPYDITVSGDGSAGALVGYLTLSSKSRHYINKAITESGSVLSHWAIDRNPDITADTLTEKIRQQKKDLNRNSLDELDIEIIVTAGREVELKPCIEYGENSFIDHSPWNMLHETYINIAFMMGSANLAGAKEAFFTTEDFIAHLNKNFSEFLPNDLHFKSLEERNEIGKRVKALYFKEDDVSVEHVRELALCFTDASYLGPGIRTARSLIREGSTVYLYEFSFVGLLNRELMAIDKTLGGAVKGDLVGYVFTQDGFVPPEDSEERRVVDLMADLWASFVKTGKPKADEVVWDPLSLSEDSEEVYLSIGAHSEQKEGIHLDRMRVWTEIYDEHFVERNHGYGRKASLVATIVTLMLSLGLWINVTHCRL